jgi:4,5-dihydroxyphthalate decarboxylase
MARVLDRGAGATLQLSTAVSPHEVFRPVIDGEAGVDGARLVVSSMHAAEIFWRQLRFAEFDVSEMSLSSLMIATSRGDTRYVALPVFPRRVFFHTWVLVHRDSGIERPQDLRGKRVGVPEYQQTAAVWTRGALQHEFGVAPQDVRWFMERTRELSHGGSTGFEAPAGVDLSFIPPDDNIGAMLRDGRLDATLLYITAKDVVDRSRIPVAELPVRPLFADPVAEGIRYLEKTGIMPINHCVVMRRELYEEHPWLALNVFDAFARAKDAVLRRSRDVAELYVRRGMLPEDAPARMAADPIPYGLKGQRHVVETLARLLSEQGLVQGQVALESVFAPSTMDL